MLKMQFFGLYPIGFFFSRFHSPSGLMFPHW